MIDLNKLKELAEAAGGDIWTTDAEFCGATGTFEGHHVWRGDGDAVVRCFANIGHMPEPIDCFDVAEFVAAANPAAVLELIALASAAAPQVVADERVAQTPVAYMAFAENGNIRVWAEKDNLGAKETSEKMGCKLMPVYAAPVQAQEPVAYTAGSHDIFELIREWAHKPEGNRYEAARKIIGYVNATYTAGIRDGKFLGASSAPVQPVAVPGESKAVSWLCTDLDGHGDVGFTKEIAKQRAGYSCDHFIPLFDIAAPAAQGDAKDVEFSSRDFRKKPVVIQAVQWTGSNLREVIAFTDGPPDTRSDFAGMMWEKYEDLVATEGLKIFTLEGKMSASIGDWIIRGIKGEFYPCKSDIFEATYDCAAIAAKAAS